MKESRSDQCEISAGADRVEQSNGAPLNYIVKESDGSKTMVVNKTIKNPSIAEDKNKK